MQSRCTDADRKCQHTDTELASFLFFRAECFTEQLNEQFFRTAINAGYF